MGNKVTIKNIVDYIQGNIRYKLYYSRFYWMISSCVLHQIEVRINSMNKTCYSQGSCIMCGCKTTALQMSNKSCDNPCYPRMLTKKELESIKDGPLFVDSVCWQLKNNTFIKYEQLENEA